MMFTMICNLVQVVCITILFVLLMKAYKKIDNQYDVMSEQAKEIYILRLMLDEKMKNENKEDDIDGKIE